MSTTSQLKPEIRHNIKVVLNFIGFYHGEWIHVFGNAHQPLAGRCEHSSEYPKAIHVGKRIRHLTHYQLYGKKKKICAP